MIQTNRARRPRRPAARDAFTLIEVLVVLVIIVLLAGLSMSAVQRIRQSQMVERSANVVSKLQTGLDNQAMAIRNQVTKERQTRSTEFNGLATFCRDDSRAEALLLYCRMRQNFPQTAAELNLAGFSVGGVSFPRPRAFASLAGITGPPDHVAAAALYAALAGQERGGLGFASDEATTGAVNQTFAIGAGTYPVYKDEFGSPISFHRFGQHPNGETNAPPYTNAKSGLRDPYDPQGLLAGWQDPQAQAYAAAAVFAYTRNAQQASPGDANWFDGTNRIPTVYSAGANRVYEGLGGDDIVGYRLRQLGARGAKQ